MGSVFDTPYAEQWTVVRPERNAQRDVVGYTEHVLRWCVYAPGASQEDVQRGDQVLNSDTLYVLESDADVVATDRVRGPRDAIPPAGTMDMGVLAPWMVDGDPQARTSPFSGWMPGIVLRLKRVRGG